METGTLIDALILGLIEGLTEFIPVSSTGHILLAGHFLGFENPGRSFEIMIQLGAILAVLSVYAARLMRIARAIPTDPNARRFVVAILLAFVPSVLMGVLLYDFIKTVLFETPVVIAIALIVGGIVLLLVDRMALKARRFDAMDYSLPMAFAIGLFQVLAMIPGVSRSGATIVGALLLGGDKRSAAEFSFFLAMPTMVGAFAYDAYRNRDAFTGSQTLLIAIGFIAAFLTALVVVRGVLEFVSRRGFAPFAWWRIGVGSVALILLAFGVGG
ncbi:MAG: undecaprenyl-diphosphate phosphatase [Bauldia sp.]|nr:undecaprenyl-diphosphate phosphatase [Bauldia sp.]MCW5717437.1 undecaprenyl-diphosphate phosphatase [Bauldia sp.]